jgi:hypothetical protein
MILCLCAHVALGGVIATSPEPGWADHVWTENEEFRWSTAARNLVSDNSAWEMRLGNASSMSDDTALIHWSGLATSHAVDLDSDLVQQTKASLNADGLSTLLADPDTFFSQMFIHRKDRLVVPHANISVSTVMLNVDGANSQLTDLAAGAGAEPNLRYIHTTNTDRSLSDLDVILSGTLNIDWSGAAPSGGHTTLYANMTQIPEPASIALVILVSVTGLYVRRRFR